MRKKTLVFTVLVIASLVLSACGGLGAPAQAADKLQEVKNRGVLLVSSDPAYPPQSELVENATRAWNTKCSSDQRTGDELRAFDIDVSKEIAKRLGVEACFVTPSWDLITAGGWADRWDISVGSMTVTPERMDKLYFTQPYYTTPAAFFVHQDNTSFTQPSDLSGKTIGGCAGCTYDFYLGGTLQIPIPSLAPSLLATTPPPPAASASCSWSTPVTRRLSSPWTPGTAPSARGEFC